MNTNICKLKYLYFLNLFKRVFTICGICATSNMDNDDIKRLELRPIGLTYYFLHFHFLVDPPLYYNTTGPIVGIRTNFYLM